MTPPSAADAARARFDAATIAHLTGELAPGVTLRSVEVAAWEAENQALWRGADDRVPAFDLRLAMTEDERAAGAALDATMAPTMAHRILLDAGDEVIGAYWGMQDTWQRYYMVYSVIARAWQGRGLYSALLRRVMQAATASGFREIYSRHRADNNAILVPKLKAGFTLAAMEVTPRFGVLVHLRYFPSVGLRQVAEHRIDGAHAAALRARGLPVS